MPRPSTRTRPSVPIAERFVLAESRSRSYLTGFVERSPITSRVTFAGVVVGLFFPLAASLRLPVRATVTPSVLKKMVWAGSNLGSYATAEEAMRELAGMSISARRIRRAVNQIGGQRVAQRKAAVEWFKEMDLPRRQAGSRAAEPPQVGVVSMDGGRYQRRDHFGDKDRPPDQNHWREDKVGCLLSMTSSEHQSDPTPELPAWLATSSAVAELAKITEKTGVSEGSACLEEWPSKPPANTTYEPPTLVSREVLASGAEAESFGWQLAARAWQRGFPGAERLAFVADGAHANWTIQKKHFSRATPILDLMHALSYAYSAADGVGDEMAYLQWARSIWQGDVDRVIGALRDHQRQIGKPPPEASPSDPRERVNRALVYYENHRCRMDYPTYRRLGLPLSSSHIESTIKQINRRVKGTEKFWSQPTSAVILQLRADYLSDSAPLDSFWLRHQARQTGANTYTQAA